jgi:hypothetical protein
MLKVALEKEGLKSGYYPQHFRKKGGSFSTKRESESQYGGRGRESLRRRGVLSDETLKSMMHRMICLEEGIFELKDLLNDSNKESVLIKAKELTGLAARSGSFEAMKICIAIQLVGREGLSRRVDELVEELLLGVRSFKENLMIERI